MMEDKVQEIEIESLKRRYVDDITRLFFYYILNIEKWSRSYYEFKYYYFESMIDSKENFVIIAKDKDKIIGFIGLIINEKEIYIKIFKKNIISFLLAIFDLIKEEPIRYIKYVIDKTIYLLTKKSPTSRNLTIENELNSLSSKKYYRLRPIIVIKEFQGTHVAQNLIYGAEEKLKERGEQKYFLQVSELNKRAIKFYEKVGFKVIKQEGNFVLMEKVLF
jgi:ribosomal protein S18 acetylase RimI-like enzyme